MAAIGEDNVGGLILSLDVPRRGRIRASRQSCVAMGRSLSIVKVTRASMEQGAGLREFH